MLVEALIGLGAALLLAKRQAANAAAPPSAKNVATDEAFDSVASNVASGDTAARISGTNTATAYSMAITNAVGTIAGYSGGFQAVYANTGGSIDKLFGGDGADPSAVVAETTLGILPIVMYVSMSSVPVFLIIAAFIFGTIEIAETASKEGNHQPDALKALEAKWTQIHQQTLQILKTVYPTKTLAALERVAVPFTDGFVLQSNRLAFLRGLKGGQGLHELIGDIFDANGVLWEHVDFQWQAGNFVGDYAPTPNGLAYRDTDGRQWPGLPTKPSVDFLKPDSYLGLNAGFVPHGERPEHLSQYVPSANRATKLVRAAIPTVTVLGVTIPGIPAVYRQYDTLAQPFIDAGTFFSNISHYSSFMSEPWGAGQTEGGTLAYGLSTGRFEGTMSPGPFSFKVAAGNSLVMVNGADGHLVFMGREAYWRDNQGRPNVMPKYTGS